MSAALPARENERLQALQDYQILDTPAEPGFDDLTLIASVICGVPISLVSLVDRDRQWFKSRRGLSVSETPRHQAFCAHTILDPERILEVTDAAADQRFADNPLVTGEPRIRFYAGAPLVNEAGHALGSLCVIDREPRTLSPEQLQALTALARQAVAQLELRATHRALKHAFEEGQRYQQRLEEYQLQLERLNSRLQTQSVTDGLTGVYNRVAFTQQLHQTVSEAARHAEPLSLIMIDVDRFKALNDEFGHVAGDEALRQVADILKGTAREADVVARYGGEEFAVILPCTSESGAHILAERFRRGVESSAWARRAITVSVGVVTRDATHERCEAHALILDADAALYQAKQTGRNRVVIAV
jgi:diguanylate cyclase (GGDEF)-like protein